MKRKLLPHDSLRFPTPSPLVDNTSPPNSAIKNMADNQQARPFHTRPHRQHGELEIGVTQALGHLEVSFTRGFANKVLTLYMHPS